MNSVEKKEDNYTTKGHKRGNRSEITNSSNKNPKANWRVWIICFLVAFGLYIIIR
jgi:hypothetical protein